MVERTVQIVEILENGDAVIQFTPEQIAELGWQEGDSIQIIMNEETNQIILTKATNNV